MDIDAKLRQKLKSLAHRKVFPMLYKKYCKKTEQVDPGLVLFADAHSDGLPDSMQLMRDEVLRAGYRVEEHCLDFGKATLVQTAKAIIRFLKSYAGAGTVFLCSYYLPASSVEKRGETRLIQLWHAAGVLKKFGFDAEEDIPADFEGNPTAGYDLVTVSSPVCVPFYEQALRLGEGVCQALGVSRTDRWYEPGFLPQCREKLLETHPGVEGKRLALWAPTFRGNAAVGETAGLGQMAQLDLGEDWMLLTKLHPNARETGGLFQPRLATEELFASAEVLITDYSTVLFEFALLGKPIVLFLPDGEAYQQGRGLYIPLEDIPAQVVTDIADLPEAVHRAAERFDAIRNQIFVEKYMSACDGEATQRILDAVFGER